MKRIVLIGAVMSLSFVPIPAPQADTDIINSLVQAVAVQQIEMSNAAISSLTTQQPTAIMYEFKDLGNNTIGAEIRFGVRDTVGNFVEQRAFRYSWVGSTTDVANLQKIGSSLKNQLSVLASSL